MQPSFMTSHLDGIGELPPSGDAPSYLRSTVMSGLGAEAVPANPAAGADLRTLLIRVAIIAAVTVILLKVLNKK